MTQWMLETLLWTAVLIAFVLLVRRPVARHFGPQIAYALWALPALHERPGQPHSVRQVPGACALPSAK